MRACTCMCVCMVLSGALEILLKWSEASSSMSLFWHQSSGRISTHLRKTCRKGHVWNPSMGISENHLWRREWSSSEKPPHPESRLNSGLCPFLLYVMPHLLKVLNQHLRVPESRSHRWSHKLRFLRFQLNVGCQRRGDEWSWHVLTEEHKKEKKAKTNSSKPQAAGAERRRPENKHHQIFRWFCCLEKTKASNDVLQMNYKPSAAKRDQSGSALKRPPPRCAFGSRRVLCSRKEG